MQNFISENVLITTSNWFYAPDGKQYRAVWGKLKHIHEASRSLGFIPNRAHANWFIEIGNMVIMGCQVMYIIQCDDKPDTSNVKDWNSQNGVFQEYERPTAIYIAV